MSYLYADDREAEKKLPADDGAQGPAAEQDEEESVLGRPSVPHGEGADADQAQDAEEDGKGAEQTEGEQPEEEGEEDEDEDETEQEEGTTAEPTPVPASKGEPIQQPRHET